MDAEVACTKSCEIHFVTLRTGLNCPRVFPAVAVWKNHRMSDTGRPENDHQPLHGFRTVRHKTGGQGELKYFSWTLVGDVVHGHSNR